MSIVLIFVIVSIINVVFSTVRSIVLLNGNKYVASVVSGLYFAFYNYVLILTTTEFNFAVKCIITCVCNIIGVFIVKLVEEKSRKDKMWEIKFSIPTEESEDLDIALTSHSIPHDYVVISPKHTTFHCYCASKNESQVVKESIKKYNAKYFVSESQRLF